MSDGTTLWDEFDAMAFNLKQQAHSGVGEEAGRALLDVAARIEQVLKRSAGTAEGRPLPDEPAVKLAGEIRPGGWYILETERMLQPQDAMRMQEQLAAKFPGTTFAILNKDLKLVTEYPGLVDAVKRAEAECDRQFNASKPESRLAWAGASMALHELVCALLVTQERDGAGAPPAAGTAAESAIATPAPSRRICGVRHPVFGALLCGMPGDHRERQHVYVGEGWVTTWEDRR